MPTRSSSTRTELTLVHGDRVVATYSIASYLPLEKAAEILAGEQSSGTFTKVALESAALTRDHAARVEAIEQSNESCVPLPGTFRPNDASVLSTGTISISFPVRNFGPSAAALLTTVAGNLYEIRELAAVKLLDIEIPEAVAAQYTGPKWGTQGTRELMGNRDETLIGTIVKPSIGLSLDQLAKLVRELAEAGIDFIKDDELNSDPPYAPLYERIRVVMRELNDAAERTGKRTMYAFNVTGDIGPMQQSVDLIASLGGNCAMVAIPAVGFPALAELRRNSDLVIHGHRAGFGAFDRHPGLGISFTVFQKIAAMCGADHLHVGGVNSKFWESNDAVVANVQSMWATSASTRMLPVLSSAQTAATAMGTYGLLPSNDMLVLAGGGIHAHPGGVAAGVASMRDAWHAVTQGKNPAEVAIPGSALDVALKTFGKTR